MIATFERLSAHEVVFRRLLEAPPEQVWKIWSDPDHLRHWFGPAGFRLTTLEFTFVPGGVWRFLMHPPDGSDIPNRIVFREVVPPSKLVYENSWDRPGAPLDFTVVVRFEADGPRTRLSIHMTFRDAAAMKTAVETYGVLEGGVETLERLASCLG